MSYSGDFESQEQEDYYHQEYMRQEEEKQQQEPDVVPCYECGKPMYLFSETPQLNICDACGEQRNVIEEKFYKSRNRY